jgi:hypothetical protein
MNELKIEYLPVDSLTPYEGNARKHAPEDIEAIKTSILHDGFPSYHSIFCYCLYWWLLS